MGLLQRACETYDCMEHLAGVEIEGQETLAPVSHMLSQVEIEITLGAGGEFLSARPVDKKEPKIVIPVTEESAGRTSAPCAHPLCDQLDYLLPGQAEKYKLYVEQLEEWERSAYTHPKLRAIVHYVRGGTILQDLEKAEVIPSGQKQSSANDKKRVCWVINGLGEGRSGPCWTDRELMQCFIGYYREKKMCEDTGLCMVSGEKGSLAGQHVKGVVSLHGNAKLISTNDNSGYTYRGRFACASQAVTIGYAASQKGHNALRWLAGNQGVAFGKRMFLCWNPQGCKLPEVTGSMSRRGKQGKRSATPTEYRRQLFESLCGWKENLPKHAGVVIAVFDAATPGRLAVTYYNELLASDFLQRLHDWERACCWENGNFGIQSPSLYSIVNWAFGVWRNAKSEADPRILSQQMQRLMACRLDGASFPPDIERILVEKASHLVRYEETEKNKPRRELLFITCAVIRKYYIDYFKEEWDMALDQDNTNRSYLFGRLLAIAEMVERSTYSREETRETNAMRMQKTFAMRPLSGWRILAERLEPYYARLAPGLRQYYRKMTETIMDKLSVSESDLNRKLDDIYILGYYHQHAWRREKDGDEVKAPEDEM